MIYLVGKEIFNKSTGIIAACLLTFLPFHIYFSKQLLVHSLALFFGLLFIFFLKKGENQNKPLYFFLSSICLAFAILTRFTYLIIIPVLFINLLLFYRCYGLKNIIYFIFGFFIMLASYFIWAKIRFGDFFFTLREGSKAV
jgi:4-amino-4-deoxy-L-arabinose transferase-like glycosyltransferase